MKWTEMNTGYRDRLRVLSEMDSYELLEIGRNVSAAELKEAYIRKVKAYHPDHADPFVRDHHQEVLKLVNAAFEHIKRVRGYGRGFAIKVRADESRRCDARIRFAAMKTRRQAWAM